MNPTIFGGYRARVSESGSYIRGFGCAALRGDSESLYGLWDSHGFGPPRTQRGRAGSDSSRT